MTSQNEHDELKELLIGHRTRPPQASSDEAERIWAQINKEQTTVRKSNSWYKPLVGIAASVALVLTFILVPSPDSAPGVLVAEAEMDVVSDSLELTFLDPEVSDGAEGDSVESYDLAVLVE